MSTDWTKCNRRGDTNIERHTCDLHTEGGSYAVYRTATKYLGTHYQCELGFCTVTVSLDSDIPGTDDERILLRSMAEALDSMLALKPEGD